MNEDYFRRLGEIGVKLNASFQTLDYATKILQFAIEKRLTSGQSYCVLAAVALYIAQFKRLGPLSEKWTQRQVADAAGITEACVRRRYHWLVDKLKLSLEPAV